MSRFECWSGGGTHKRKPIFVDEVDFGEVVVVKPVERSGATPLPKI